MWIEYNPNPNDRRTEDCMVRVVAKVTNQSWDDAFAMLVSVAFIQKTMPGSKEVLGIVLKKLGFTRHAIPNTCPICYTEKDFCDEHPEGTYVLCTDNHVAVVQSGNIYDAYDSSMKIPMFYWAKEKS